MLDHFGVTAHHRHSRLGRSFRHGIESPRHHIGRGAGFKNERRQKRHRTRARDGKIVDGAINRQRADAASGKLKRLDHKTIGGESQRPAAKIDNRRIRQPVQYRISQLGQNQALDKTATGFASCAMGKLYLAVFERVLRISICSCQFQLRFA